MKTLKYYLWLRASAEPGINNGIDRQIWNLWWDIHVGFYHDTPDTAIVRGLNSWRHMHSYAAGHPNPIARADYRRCWRAWARALTALRNLDHECPF